MKTSREKCDRCGEIKTVYHSRELELKYCEKCLDEQKITKNEF